MTWLRDGDVIMPGTTKDEPHIMVDVSNTLKMTDVSQADKGTYTCFVGNRHMLEVMVNVKPATQGKRLRSQPENLQCSSTSLY